MGDWPMILTIAGVAFWLGWFGRAKTHVCELRYWRPITQDDGACTCPAGQTYTWDSECPVHGASR